METDRTEPFSAPLTAPVVVIYLLSLVLSACSLLYELLIAQTLTLIAGNMVIWYSLTVGTYLAAMGVGAILYGSPDRSRGWRPLFRVEIMLSLIGAIGGVIVTVTPPFLDRLRLDDAGFVISCHCFCGAWGAIVAFWMTERIWLPGQLLGTGAIAGFSFVMSLLIWTALKYTIGVRSAPLESIHPGEAENR